MRGPDTRVAWSTWIHSVLARHSTSYFALRHMDRQAFAEACILWQLPGQARPGRDLAKSKGACDSSVVLGGVVRWRGLIPKDFNSILALLACSHDGTCMGILKTNTSISLFSIWQAYGALLPGCGGEVGSLVAFLVHT